MARQIHTHLTRHGGWRDRRGWGLRGWGPRGLSLEECCLYLNTHISQTAKNKQVSQWLSDDIQAPSATCFFFIYLLLNNSPFRFYSFTYWFSLLLFYLLPFPAPQHFVSLSTFFLLLPVPPSQCVTPISASPVCFVTARQFNFFTDQVVPEW